MFGSANPPPVDTLRAVAVLSAWLAYYPVDLSHFPPERPALCRYRFQKAKKLPGTPRRDIATRRVSPSDREGLPSIHPVMFDRTKWRQPYIHAVDGSSGTSYNGRLANDDGRPLLGPSSWMNGESKAEGLQIDYPVPGLESDESEAWASTSAGGSPPSLGVVRIPAGTPRDRRHNCCEWLELQQPARAPDQLAVQDSQGSQPTNR